MHAFCRRFRTQCDKIAHIELPWVLDRVRFVREFLRPRNGTLPALEKFMKVLDAAPRRIGATETPSGRVETCRKRRSTSWSWKTMISSERWLRNG